MSNFSDVKHERSTTRMSRLHRSDLMQKSAVYLILERGNEILMLERCNTGYMDGYYSFVAGHVEPGESVTGALMREAREEAGITTHPDNLIFVHACHRLSDSIYYDFFFRTTCWIGEVTNMEPDKCSNLRWFPKDALPQNTIPYIRKVVTFVYTEQRSFSEYNWEER